MPETPPKFELPQEIQEPETATCRLVAGNPAGQARIGLVIKRTYAFRPGGGCELLGPEQQDEVVDDECLYEVVQPPKVSAVALDNDLWAFRSKTDLVIQGNAYAYFPKTRKSWVEVRVGGFSRSIRVYGERNVERGPDGEIRFSRPEPFEAIPVRYDRAYGGCDLTALERYGFPPALRDLLRSRPEYEAVAETPFHYPRNPAGRGFLIEADEESLSRVEVPNLEFAFDPITPDRLAVGDPGRWIDAPLPACMDWQSASWFPRIAYIGLAPLPDGFAGRVAEVERRWAAPDLLRNPSILKAPDRPLHPEFAQAASPGMSFEGFPPDAVIELHNMHRDYPVCTLELPGEAPRARLEFEGAGAVNLEPHLNSVVIRPDHEQAVMTWCAHAPRPARLTHRALQGFQFTVSWDSDPLGGLL
jgi:hypothetical protein